MCPKGLCWVAGVRGNKDRYTLLPNRLVIPLQDQIAQVQVMHAKDLSQGYGWPSLPRGLKQKYGQSLKDLSWQYVFMASRRCLHPIDQDECRHH